MNKDLERILKIIDEEPSKFNSKIPGIEKKIFREISFLLKELKVTGNGNIESSIENLDLINAIKGKMNKILVSKEYADLVKRFVSNFPAISNYQTNIPDLSKGAKKMISAVTKQNINNTLESLVGAGYKQEVVSKLNNILLTSVTSGGSYSDLIEMLQSKLVSTEKKPGMLSKYSKTYVTDALGQLAGQGNKMIADDLKSEWFEYVGSNLTTTREFCEHLTEKRYVHKSEIPEILKGNIDGHQCEIYEKTGLPKGMIEGTNSTNFVVYRGGHKCRHQLIPVNELAVPKNIRDKFNRINEQDTVKSAYQEITKKVVGIEDEIRKNKDFETAVVFDKYGNVIIDKRGDHKSVAFTDDEILRMKDAVFTHNHPKGWGFGEKDPQRNGNSFSGEDLDIAIRADLKEIRVVTPKYTFSMKRPEKGWGVSSEDFKLAFVSENFKLQNEFLRKIKKGDMEIQQAEATHFHILSKRLSEKFKWQYEQKETNKRIIAD